MTDRISPLAGEPVPAALLMNVPRLITAYYSLTPDPSVPAQRVAFGTSGHRGSALAASFNEAHILAVTQAVCLYREKEGITGPLYLGVDTHGLSEPALASALEVLAANGVETLIDTDEGYTPTPVISHAILAYNRRRTSGLADGIVISPSHNPPEDGGFKYNAVNGGPADVGATGWIQATANALLEADLAGVKRIPYARALTSPHVHRHDYRGAYVPDLAEVLDMDAVRGAGVRIGVDPLGGAAVAYWERIAEVHGLDLTVVNEAVDPTFRFMTLDWDGKIRMDCSSPYAMRSLIGRAGAFDVAFANDTDADRHGIVCPSIGLMSPNPYLATAIAYLYAHRPAWRVDCAIGKTAVSSGMIDRVAARLGRRVIEVPVGFKWFSGGLVEGTLGFGGEESAGASFLRKDGGVWTTDKDGLILGLLAAEIRAVTGRDPAEYHTEVTQGLGQSHYERIDAPATPEQKARLGKLEPADFAATDLAGEAITAKLTRAPGNDQPLGGIKVTTANGWFAARPSGTENVYKIYAESFLSEEHLRRIQTDAQTAVDGALGG